MAQDNDIALNINVNGVEKSIESLKDLKTAIKEATNEQIKAAEKFGIGSKEYEQASKRVSSLKDKVDDLKDSTKSLQGSGIERASQGFNQLGEGLRNLDFDKVKTGLIAMKSALAAVGIGLIVQAVSYLIENFDSLSQGSGVLAKTLRTVGEILNGVKEALYSVTDAIGATNHQLDLMGEKVTENSNKFKEGLNTVIREYDRLIAVQKAQGKNTEELELKKQEQILYTNSLIVKQIEAYVRAGGELNEEKKKLLTTSLENIKDAMNQSKLAIIDGNKKELEEDKKKNEEYKKLLDQRAKDELDTWNKTLEIRRAYADGAKADDERLRQEKLAADKAELDEFKQYAQQVSEDERVSSVSDAEFKSQLRANELEEFKHNKDQQVAAAQAALQSTQALTDLYFNWQLSKNKKNSEEEKRIRKRQFQVNKAFGIANSIIDGVGGIAKALNNPYPLNIVLAVAAGVAATANTAKIAMTKFDDGGSSGGGGGAGESAPSIPIPAPPSIDTQKNNTSTTFDDSGKKIGGSDDGKRIMQPTITVKAQVVETEMTQKQQDVKQIETQNKF